MISTSSRKRTFGSQSRIFFAFAGVADEEIDFRRPLVAGIVFHVFLPIEIGPPEGDFEKLADGVGLVRREDEIVAFVVLQNPPHPLDIFRRVAPVAFRIEIAEEKLLLEAVLNRRDRAA